MDIRLRVANRIRQRQRIFRRQSKQMKRKPLRCFLANSRQVFQFIYQSFNRSGKIWHASV